MDIERTLYNYVGKHYKLLQRTNMVSAHIDIPQEKVQQIVLEVFTHSVKSGAQQEELQALVTSQGMYDAVCHSENIDIPREVQGLALHKLPPDVLFIGKTLGQLHHEYAKYALQVEEFDEAFTHLKAAVDDPSSPEELSVALRIMEYANTYQDLDNAIKAHENFQLAKGICIAPPLNQLRTPATYEWIDEELQRHYRFFSSLPEDLSTLNLKWKRVHKIREDRLEAHYLPEPLPNVRYHGDFMMREYKDLLLEQRDIRLVKLGLTDVSGCMFRDCDFSYSFWIASKLARCFFQGGSLSRTDFSDSQLLQCRFEDIRGQHIDCERATFEGCRFTRCDFKNALLNECRFIECLIEDCDFQDAQQRETSFENCRFVGLKQEQLKGANTQMLGGREN